MTSEQRVHIEAVVKDLGREVTIDREADMAYIDVHLGVHIHRTVEVSDGVLADYATDGRLVGVEVFLLEQTVLTEDVVALKRVLASPGTS